MCIRTNVAFEYLQLVHDQEYLSLLRSLLQFHHFAHQKLHKIDKLFKLNNSTVGIR